MWGNGDLLIDDDGRDCERVPSLPCVVPPPVSLVLQPSLFREPSQRRYLIVPHGKTLLELVLEAGMARLGPSPGDPTVGIVSLAGGGDLVVTIDGNVIDRRYWHCCTPGPGRLVNIAVMPTSQRQAILIGASLAIATAAILTGGLLAAPGGALALSIGAGGALAVGGIASAAIAVGGNYALTAFLPPEEENSGSSGPQDSSHVTGDSNRLDQYSFVPIVLANAIQIVPDHYARPYSEAAGSDTYWRMLLCVGQGPLRITEVKAGGTLLDSLPNDYDYQVREGRVGEPPLTLFTQDIHEINPASTLGEVFASSPQIQTMQAGSTQGTVDITFPQGIFHQGKVNRDAYSVVYTVERSPTGAGTWTDFITGSGTLAFHTERHETSNLIRRTHRTTNLDPDVTYDVRVRRRNGDGGSQNPSAMFWTALRSIQPNDPRPDKTIACIAIRAKRDGNVPVITCMAGTYALDWNGVAWVEAVTGNPSSLGRHLLQGDGINANPIADARLDLPSWEAFHDFCDTEGFEFNGVFDNEAMVLDRIHIVLAAGRGRLIPPDTKYAVAIDRAGKSMSGMISPRNSSDYQGVHILRDRLHALRVLFINENNWEADERLVYGDGFNAGNTNDGNVEVFDLTRAGITNPDTVWRHARWRLADIALRLGIHSVRQGIESLQHVPGDLVLFQHYVPLLGLTRGRIKSVSYGDDLWSDTIPATAVGSDWETYVTAEFDAVDDIEPGTIAYAPDGSPALRAHWDIGDQYGFNTVCEQLVAAPTGDRATVTLRYKVYLDAAVDYMDVADFGGSSTLAWLTFPGLVGGQLWPGPNGFAYPTGNETMEGDNWSARLRVDASGRIGPYLYVQNKPGAAGWMRVSAHPMRINDLRGRWTEWEQTCVMNTPGSPDGRCVVRVDGQVLVDVSDIEYRDTGFSSVVSNGIRLQAQVTGTSGNPNATAAFDYWLKDFAITEGVAGEVISVTIDDLVTMEVGQTYAARVRLIDDSGVDQYVLRDVTTVPGDGYTLTFPTPFDATASPAVGDLLTFGEAGLETVRCIVKDVLPGPDLTAQLLLIDEAPGIYDADTGEIPPYISQITLPGDFFGLAPAVPVISRVEVQNVSHNSQPDLITQQQLIVQLAAASTSLPPPIGYELEIKRAEQELYQTRRFYPGTAVELSVDIVQSDALYDIRVRAVGRSGSGRHIESAWSTVVQQFVPLPQVTYATTARVAGLELQGQTNDTQFEGPDAHFVWRITATSGGLQVHGGDSQLIGFVDPQFAWFEVKIIDPATSYVRRLETTTTPQFIYTIADNKEDSRKQSAALGGSSRPLRQFAIQVKFTDRFGRQGPGQVLTVSNPAPEIPEGLIVSGKVLAINVRTNPPEDDDFEGTIVYVGAQSGFDPTAPSTQVFKDLSNTVLIADQPGGVTKFVRVAHADRFSQEVPDLNLSSEIAVVIEAPDGPPQFRPSQIKFTRTASTDTVRWTAGTMHVMDGASVVEEPVSAGQATWTTGVLWLYYVRGFGAIQATTNAALANQPDRHVLAQYLGGPQLTISNAFASVANLVTAQRLGTFGIGQNSGFQTLLRAEPITVAGNPVQIIISLKEMIAFFAGVNTATEVRIRLARDGPGTTTTWFLGRASLGAAGGTNSLQRYATTMIYIHDSPGPGSHTYRVDAEWRIEGNTTQSDIDFNDLALIIQEAMY